MTAARAAGTTTTTRQKYGNVKGQIDGYTFDSKAEGMRYLVLRSMLQTGEIMDLEVHPSYDLWVGGMLICRYVADFRYAISSTGEIVTEDVKGVKTAVYQIKKKLMRAIHGLVIKEVKVR